MNRLVHMRRHRSRQGFRAGDGLYDEALGGLKMVNGDRTAWKAGLVASYAPLQRVAETFALGHY